MKIPRVNPEIQKRLPNQFCEILNKAIEKANSVEDIQKTIKLLEKMLGDVNGVLASLQQQIDDIRPIPPTPTGDWIQERQFDIANMGSELGMCLQNTRLGFGITTPTFPTARADMNSQIANGTLHSGTPPVDISVPIYYNNNLDAGHIAVWDRGVVYSDKRLYGSIDAVDGGYTGWGELCDGARVVQRKA